MRWKHTGGGSRVRRNIETVQVCRNAIRKAKAYLELNLVRDIKNNKKVFYRYVKSGKKTSENVGQILNESGDW